MNELDLPGGLVVMSIKIGPQSGAALPLYFPSRIQPPFFLHFLSLHFSSLCPRAPSMASSYILSLLLLIFLSLSSTPALSQSPTPSVYDILRQFGLPSGLLPDCVSSYSFNPEDGSFEVELDNPCYVQFDYLVYYDKRITGTLKLGSITNLKGIQVKSFFLWLDVDEIKVDLPPSDAIYFQVGFINKKLSVDQFQTIHSCTSGASLSRSGKLIFELPPPVDEEMPMLSTE